MRSRLIIPCNTMHIQLQLSAIGMAIAKLNTEGFTVDRIELDGYTRPTITVNPGALCYEKQKSGEAVRYAQGTDEIGKYERFQIQVDNCRVSWEVR